MLEASPTERCRECGREIYAGVVRCPYCGHWSADDRGAEDEFARRRERVLRWGRLLGWPALLGLLIPTLIAVWYLLRLALKL